MVETVTSISNAPLRVRLLSLCQLLPVEDVINVLNSLAQLKVVLIQQELDFPSIVLRISSTMVQRVAWMWEDCIRDHYGRLPHTPKDLYLYP